MKFRSSFAVSGIAALAFASAVHAADIPVKAAPVQQASFFSSAYPYQSSGIFFGAYVAGSAGSASANVPGINSASLTTTDAEIGATVGWAWGQKNSQIAYTLEGDFAVTNFNGNQAGLSLTGPLSFEQIFTIWTPTNNIANLLPTSISNLLTVPPFQALPAGVTASNLQSGFGIGAKEKDISSAFQGVAANKTWLVEPALRLAAMEQLSNGSALYAYGEVAIPADGKIFGPVPGLTVTLAPEYTAGVGVRW